ncbi:ABC transporter permease subunit [Caulobacter sp. S45]|uniref:ABC transporter permease n=1 Tax=Caulobacter sp. S45 TaxID=1641861 RepID=UPI0020C6D53C|nr:ABC transporter permease subunit [Caulobacter sp. S45]
MATVHPLLAVRLLDMRKSWRFVPSVWDALIFALVIGGLALIAIGGHETLQPLAHSPAISLDPRVLPNYALRTTLRMLAAIICSTLFTFAYGALAVKSRRAEQVLIPLLDILQSVPVFSFLSFTITFFLALFPGQVFGAELASIFAIFTAQAWNMTFSFYQSLKTVPRDLSDVSDSLRLGPWRRFWVLEVPFAAPGLIWNAMMSMSGAWFFVVISEAVTVGHVSIALPGIGSYVGLAIARQNLGAIGWAILAMGLVILAYDQLLFRPLVAWSEKFTVELSSRQGAPPQSWVLNFIQRAQLARRIWMPFANVAGVLTRVHVGGVRPPPRRLVQAWSSRGADYVWYTVLALLGVWAAWRVVAFVGREVGPAEVLAVIGLGGLTLVRVLVLIVLASLIWVPIGILVGLRPRWTQAVQPVAQFMAAFPNNLFFPVVVVGIVHFHLAPDVWLSPLMILGTQWYILFNVIAGASAFPNDLREAASSFGVKGWSWWRKVMLPGIFPYYVTGAITASGGAWNASTIAELVNWGHTRLVARGLGAFIFQSTERGDFPRVVLGTAVMSLFVVLFNRVLWRPLFNYAAKRLRMD